MPSRQLQETQQDSTFSTQWATLTLLDTALVTHIKRQTVKQTTSIVPSKIVAYFFLHFNPFKVCLKYNLKGCAWCARKHTARD